MVEWTQAWMNGYGTLRRCTERTGAIGDYSLFLAAAFVVTRQLIRRARTSYRWPSRPTTRRPTERLSSVALSRPSPVIALGGPTSH